MGAKVLEAHGEIDEIKFSMPNKHHFLVDLSPFGLDNPNEVFFAADRPYGLIEATVQREDASPGRDRLVPVSPDSARASGNRALAGRDTPVALVRSPGAPARATAGQPRGRAKLLYQHTVSQTPLARQRRLP